MSYDFDWLGSTLAIGDGEGQSLVLELDPSHNQQGVDAPGLLSAITDFVNAGVFNGNFRLGPPDPSQNIDVASSTSGSNFMRGWRFVQSSNTNITLKQVRDASSASGSNLRFTFGAGAASDAAYIEQLVDIGGNRQRQVGDILRASAALVSGANVFLRLRMQYLNVDGGIAGMPAESVSSGVPAAASWTQAWAAGSGSSNTPPPAGARYLRLRVEAYRSSGSSAAAIDLYDVRRDRGIPYVVIPDRDAAYQAGYLAQANGFPSVYAPKAGAGTLMPLVNIVPLAFVFDQIPVNATTEMRPSDTLMALGGSPRIIMPFAGSIVGMSYRINAAPTAGTINFQATVAGVNVWSGFGALGTAMALADKVTQPLNTDTFSAGDGIGVQMVTSAAYTPGTRHAHVVLWVAVHWQNV